MLIKGSVEDIIFHNPENGYTVANFDWNGRLIVIVGIFPTITEGEILALKGEFKDNPKFGEQFAVTDIEFLLPEDEESIRRYLSSGLFRGVGEVTASALVDYFGRFTLDVIENHPEKLTQVPGIGQKKASDIINSYNETKKYKDTLLFLSKLGFGITISLRIFKEYEDAAIDLIKENPYRLVQDIKGVGFYTADKAAEKLGIDKESEFRLQAGLIHILQEAANRNGHTYLPKNILLDDAAHLLETSVERLEPLIYQMPFMLKQTAFSEDEISLISIYRTERSIASKLTALNGSSCSLGDLRKEIENYEKTSFPLDETQKQAIETALSCGVTVITGGPGTGKTTIIRCITTLLKQRNMTVALTAPTGRASKRMSEATGEDAKTIHRLLNLTGGEVPDQITVLDCDVVICDEISMVDIFIFNALLKAIPLGSRLILVGDKDQLPSVACGNILADIINSKLFPTVELKSIYRQAEESMIIVNAHRINNGIMPKISAESDFFIDNKGTAEEVLDSVISMVTERIPKYLSISPKDIQVLAPVKKGIAGVENLNKKLQQALNPNGEQTKHLETVFRVSDKVMQTANNYAMEWERIGMFREKGTGVFNGDIGYVIDIKDGITVEFEDGKICRYKGADLDEIMLAYCISVHKSQGCEFPVAIIAISGSNHAIMTRNLLYTAVTRAKTMSVIVGSMDSVAYMVGNNYTAKRYSLLLPLLLQNHEKYIGK